MGKSLRNSWMALCVAQAALAGCSGDQLHLGGNNGPPTGCVPGAYLGTYDCNMGDASPLPMNNGAILFNLQGERYGTTLTIASGAKLSGMPMSVPGLGDFSFAADLSGTVDCNTYKLTGQMSNITFNSATTVTKVLQNGDLSADYEPNVSPQTLINGVLSSPASSIFPGTSPSTNYCSWGATLQP